MTPRFWIAAAVAWAITSVAAAQTQQNSNNQREAAAAAANATITVTGCLQRGDADGSVAGTALGTSVPPADAGVVANVNPQVGFLLTDATPVNEAREAAAGAGTAGTSGSGDAKPGAVNHTSYVLEGSAEQFMENLGKRMAVTGTLAPASASGAGTRPAGSDDARAHAGTPAVTGGGDRSDPLFRTGIQRIKVGSIKPAAGDCSTR